MENEIWKDIDGYEGLYQVSNLGRVKSLNYHRTGKERIMKPKKDSKGYLQVLLCKESKVKHYFVHRLVAVAFVDNPQNLPIINHIDENPKNNNANNLEWCTQKYNINYGTRNKKASEKLRGRKLSEEHKEKIAEKMKNNPKKIKPIIGISKVSGLILEFPSLKEASRQTGINQGHICECCNGKRKSAGGFYWLYADEDDDTE